MTPDIALGLSGLIASKPYVTQLLPDKRKLCGVHQKECERDHLLEMGPVPKKSGRAVFGWEVLIKSAW
jgi:hypothetical protein